MRPSSLSTRFLVRRPSPLPFLFLSDHPALTLEYLLTSDRLSLPRSATCHELSLAMRKYTFSHATLPFQVFSCCCLSQRDGPIGRFCNLFTPPSHVWIPCSQSSIHPVCNITFHLCLINVVDRILPFAVEGRIWFLVIWAYVACAPVGWCGMLPIQFSVYSIFHISESLRNYSLKGPFFGEICRLIFTP